MNKQRRILLLGGSAMQVPSIVKAKEMGLYVITCDYLSSNPGHKFADEYHNVSTTDKEAVLALAKTLKIDGILAYASDPAAPTAAYVAEKLGLQGSPYKSVEILTHKDQFRAFLREHGFNCPRSCGYNSIESAKADLYKFKLPIMVKPTDSAGSKGVAKLTDYGQFELLAMNALQYSREKRFILEEYVDGDECQIGGDGFSVKGELAFHCFTDQYFGLKCSNPFTLIAAGCPMNRSQEVQNRLHIEIQRVLTLLKMETQAYNFESRVDRNGEIWLMEIGPRNGGNLIAQLIEYATDVPFVEWMIRAALGEDCSALKQIEPKGCYAYYVLHSRFEGKFSCVTYSEAIRKNILEEHLYVRNGDHIMPFTGSGQTLGMLLLHFSSMEEMLYRLDHMEEFLSVQVEAEEAPMS